MNSLLFPGKSIETVMLELRKAQQESGETLSEKQVRRALEDHELLFTGDQTLKRALAMLEESRTDSDESPTTST